MHTRLRLVCAHSQRVKTAQQKSGLTSEAWAVPFWRSVHATAGVFLAAAFFLLLLAALLHAAVNASCGVGSGVEGACWVRGKVRIEPEHVRKAWERSCA